MPWSNLSRLLGYEILDESKFPLYDRTDGDGASRREFLEKPTSPYLECFIATVITNYGSQWTSCQGGLRDRELREFQNLFEEKGFREVLEDQVSDLTVRLNSAQAGLDKEKVDRKSELSRRRKN